MTPQEQLSNTERDGGYGYERDQRLPPAPGRLSAFSHSPARRPLTPDPSSVLLVGSSLSKLAEV